MKRKWWKIAVLLLLVAVLLSGGMRPVCADEPPPQVALRYVAQTYGVNQADLQVVGQGVTRYPLTGQTIWRGEIYDRRTHQPYAVCVDAQGRVVDLAQVQAQERAAHTARYGKLEPALHELLQTKADSDIMRVLVWLAPVDHAAIQAELTRQFPDAGFVQGHPT